MNLIAEGPGSKVEGAGRTAAVTADHLAYLDALRGVAILGVILFHAGRLGALPSLKDLDPLFEPVNSALQAVSGLGYLGVHLFLVVSGFSLAYGPLRRGCGKLNLGDFGRRRARRILPAYFVSLALWSFVALMQGSRLARPSVWWDIPAHALLVHNLFPATVLTINGSFWSLGLEWQWYFCFPILLCLARRFGFRPILIATLVLGVAWQRMAWFFFPDAQFQVGNAFYWALPGRLFEFACGMAAAAVVVSGGQRAAYRAAIAVATLLPLLAVETLVESRTFGVWNDHMWGAVFGLGLIALSGVTPVWFTGRLLGRALSYAGTISYSLYLVHEPILRMVLVPALIKLPPGIVFSAFWVLIFPLLVLCGLAFYRLFEAPWLKQRGGGRADRQVADLAIWSQKTSGARV